MSKTSFSQTLKAEILEVLDKENEARHLTLALALAASAVFSPVIALKNKSLDYILYLQSVARKILAIQVSVVEKKNVSIAKVSEKNDITIVKQFLDDSLGFSSLRGVLSAEAKAFSSLETVQMLRTAFLSIGSMANPRNSYQIEFSCRRLSVLKFIKQLLEQEGIESILVSNSKNYLLYIKSGDQIADYLAIIGANIAYLDFENIRVAKTMNEHVNRTINFDNANIERVVNTSTRQINIIEAIHSRGGFDRLPEDLKEIAQLRLENPGSSLRELGSLLDPPLGKSGVYHRLGKLEAWAENFIHEHEAEEEEE